MKRVQFENKRWLRIWLILLAMCVLVLILGETTEVLAEDPTGTPTPTATSTQSLIDEDKQYFLINPENSLYGQDMEFSLYSEAYGSPAWVTLWTETLNVSCGAGNQIHGLLVRMTNRDTGSAHEHKIINSAYPAWLDHNSANGYYYRGAVPGGNGNYWNQQIYVIEQAIGDTPHIINNSFPVVNEEMTITLTYQTVTTDTQSGYYAIAGVMCFGEPPENLQETSVPNITPFPTPEGGYDCPQNAQLYFDYSQASYGCECSASYPNMEYVYPSTFENHYGQYQDDVYSVYDGTNYRCTADSAGRPNMLNNAIVFRGAYLDDYPAYVIQNGFWTVQDHTGYTDYWAELYKCLFDIDELICTFYETPRYGVSYTATPLPSSTPTMTPTPEATFTPTMTATATMTPSPTNIMNIPTITSLSATNTAIVPTYYPGTGTPGGGASVSGESGGTAPGESYEVGGGEGSVSYGGICDDGSSQSVLPNYFEGTAFPGSSGGSVNPAYQFEIDCYEASDVPLVGSTSLEMTVSPGACYLLWPHFSISVPGLFGIGETNLDIDGWRICPYWVTLPNLEILGLDLLNQVLMAIAAFTIIRMLWRF